MNLDLEHITETYVQCCTTEGKSPQTIKSYQTDLKRFITFLKEAQQSLLVADIGLLQVRNYIYHLQKNVKRWENNPKIHQDTYLSSISVQDYSRSLKCFWSWLLREGYIEKNPLINL
jgi:site-specific recombinase XerD